MHELIKILGVLAWVAGLLLLLVDPVVAIGVLVLALLLTIRNVSLTREKRHQELLDATRQKDA